MSVAAAGGAVSTQLHQPTAEQIRLAQLIDDKKHGRHEVQETVRKVLDVVANSNPDDVLLALHDCDYDCEKAVALLIEKGHEVANGWQTATSHKISKKQQQQQKAAGSKNGHGDVNENGQYQQQTRGNSGQTSRGKSRRFQQNGGDSQQTNNPSQPNDNYAPPQRQRGGSGFPRRFRGSGRGGNRATDRNYSQQQTQDQDSNLDNTSPSDTNRRNRGQTAPSSQQEQQQPQEQWDVGNWNGETLIYSRTAKEGEQLANSDPSSKGLNGQADSNNPVQSSKPDFDPIEAARQIKNVIGIGQQAKPSTTDQQQQPKSKSLGQSSNTKLTPPPPARIPQQPVIFTDRFDGGVNKIDVQFGSLDDSSSSAMFYQQKQHPSESGPSNKLSQRTAAPEQTAHISPSNRSTDQPVINNQAAQPQRVLPAPLQQQPAMTMKPIVTPQYAVHQQQPHQINPQNLLLQSLFYHHQTPQPESVALDTSYDPNTFSLPSIDFNSTYLMTAPPPPQQQTQPRYLVSQPPPPPPQQPATGTKNVQAPTGSASSSSTTAKKGPAIPPGIFAPTGPPPTLPQQSAYSAAYGVQQPSSGAAYSTPYDAEHLFANTFISLNNPQQTQSPTGTYGSVTPPNQQQANNTNENKTLNYGPPPITENMMLLQQYQQFALQQSNSQQQGQQPGTHSPATLSYFLGHPPSAASYSPGHQIMYAQAATAMPQQQAPKQQNHQYNQTNPSAGLSGNNDYYNRNSSSATKEGQYMYAATNQSQSSTGQQQQGVNKQQQQQQQRPGGNVYNNQQGHQRPYQ